MFPFQIDLSRLSYATALDIIAPVLPGGTIALGWLYSHVSVWSSLQDEKTLKIIIALFAIYVAGLAVLYVSAFELGIVALAVLVRKTELNEPWKNGEWRKLASAFLGPELSPPIEETAEPVPEEPPTLTNFEKLCRAIKQNFTRAMAPVNFRLRWQKWYEILRVYFPVAKTPERSFGTFYFSVLNSIGLAGLISACISAKHITWLVWFACILLISVSHVSFTINFSQENNPDPNGDLLAAEILRAIRNRDTDD